MSGKLQFRMERNGKINYFRAAMNTELGSLDDHHFLVVTA